MRRVVVALALITVMMLNLVPLVGADGEQAVGTLVNSAGTTIGEVRLGQAGGTVTVKVTYGNIPVGTHGIHFHAVGKCDGPDFMSAGGHFNPANKKHGLQNPEGSHGGDLPNLVADGGTATQSGYAYSATTTAVTLSSGPSSLFDADGAALVIHANADDNVTDPSGNSGARIACAVLAPTTAAPGLPNTGFGGAQRGDLWPQAAILALLTLALSAAASRATRERWGRRAG